MYTYIVLKQHDENFALKVGLELVFGISSSLVLGVVGASVGECWRFCSWRSKWLYKFLRTVRFA
jgi:hypothetical protein